MANEKAKLTEKQKRFADYYIELANGAEAAIKAGYSVKAARGIASDNLKKPAVKDYIEKIMAQKDAERIASQDEVLEFLTKVMRNEIKEEVPILNGDGYQRLVDKDMSAKDRAKAAELLGKRYALWTDKKEIDASMAVTFVDNLEDDE